MILSTRRDGLETTSSWNFAGAEARSEEIGPKRDEAQRVAEGDDAHVVPLLPKLPTVLLALAMTQPELPAEKQKENDTRIEDPLLPAPQRDHNKQGQRKNG